MATVIGRRLREARVRRELTQEEVGVRAGMEPEVAATRVSQYERGQHLPKLSLAETLARVVGVPTAYLYAEDDQLADWILVFSRLSATKRRAILQDAGVTARAK